MGGTGIAILAGIGDACWQQEWHKGTWTAFFAWVIFPLVLLIPLWVALLCLKGATLCFRQQYRSLVGNFAVLGTIVVWVALSRLVNSIDLSSLVLDSEAPTYLGFIGLPLSLLILLGPLYAAFLFYRFCLRIEERPAIAR